MSPVFNPDFSEAVSFKPGKYQATISSVEERTSQQGAPMLNWSFAVEMGGQRPITMFFNTMLAGRGAANLRELVRASVNPTYESGAINTDTMLGKRITVVCDRKTNSDGAPRKYLDVVEVAPPVGTAPAPHAGRPEPGWDG